MSKLTQKKIVAIGGGHGLGRLLSALKIFGSRATGIVTTTDNGGSTGRIRECQGGIAWGDTRNCINQLITEPSINSMMFEYRFKGEGELNGHNLGNLILVALNNLSVRPLDAINMIRNILHVDVNIIPMSETPSDLLALAKDNTWISGETSVDSVSMPLIHLELDPLVSATKEAIIAINEADIILLGPGSFITSVMPPLLLAGIAHAIAANKQAKLVYIDNIAKERGPAGLMSLDEKIHWCERACQHRPIDVILTPHERPLSSLDRETFVTDLSADRLASSPLTGDLKDWRHDRLKLQQAILAIMASFETNAPAPKTNSAHPQEQSNTLA